MEVLRCVISLGFDVRSRMCDQIENAACKCEDFDMRKGYSESETEHTVE